MRASIHAFGMSLAPFLTIPQTGELLGVSRATAYRIAESDEWPTVGGEGCHKRVNLVALLGRLDVPYTFEESQ